MKLRSHFVFSVGLLVLVTSFIVSSFYFSLLVSSFISVLGNSVIDKLGHREVLTRRGQVPVRTPLTHTLPRSVFWGLIASIPVIILLSLLYGIVFNAEIFTALIGGILVGPSHMLLDVFTERGIYVKRNGKWRRFALAHFSYDNPLVNGLAILLGVIMLLAALYLHNYHYYNYYS
jgi:hypothetical protein